MYFCIESILYETDHFSFLFGDQFILWNNITLYIDFFFLQFF